MTFSLKRPAFRAKRLLVAPLAAATLLLSACGGDDEEIEYVERPVEYLYNVSLDTLQQGNYRLAALRFNEVERQHPYSVWATKAQLMSGYASYQANDYDNAINTFQRFIDLNPGHPDIAYAYYMIAISYYEQISDVERDQRMTREALVALEELVRRFPESDYARDGRLKIDLARDHLAGKNMEIGRWYERRGDYLAAINRFQTVVRDYQTTTHTPEALHRLVECYLAIGLYPEAQSVGAVLGHNFPGSEWYSYSYALLNDEELSPEAYEGSWISGVWNSVF